MNNTSLPDSITTLAIISHEVPLRRSPVTPFSLGPVPHYLGVNSAGDAIVKLGVQFGKLITSVAAGISDISHSSGFNDVTNNKLLDGLVLRDTPGAVGAPHRLDVATTVLRPPSIPPLLSHDELNNNSTTDRAKEEQGR